MYAQNQWIKLSVVLLIALLARVALGEGRRPASSQGVRSEIQTGRTLPFELSIGPGAIAWSSPGGNATGIVANLGTMIGVSRTTPLYVGMDFGVGFLSVNPTTNGTYIRLTPSVVYRIELPKADNVHPFLGLSIGPNVTILSTNFLTASSTDTKAYLEMLTRLGIAFDLSSQIGLSVESKIGTLGGDLVFMPLTQLVISL